MTPDRQLLQECRLQLEYLNDKFSRTATTHKVLHKLNYALGHPDEMSTRLTELTDENQKLKFIVESGFGGVTNSFTAEEVVEQLEQCDTIDDGIMFFNQIIKTG